jgi:endonuclease/exonuclease/phosphatase family metal-dependent hydrolase
MIPHHIPLLRPLAPTIALFATACAATQPVEPAGARPAATITIDGEFTDWPSATAVEAVADDRHLFIRFTPGETAHAIQAAPFTTRILIDADDNPATGMPLDGFGIDTAVLLSPPNATGVGIGARVLTYDAQGFATPAGHADIGFLFQPTYASAAYEARIDRASLTRPSGKSLRIRVDQVAPGANVLWSNQTALAWPPASTALRGAPALPDKPADATRVLSLNVLNAAPLTNPDAFRRTIRALDPDVILFQEWFNTAQPAIQAWVTTHLGPGWSVFAPSTNGIAIATRHPVLETVGRPLPGTGPGANARFAAAVIDAPGGPIIAASLHLKCCGGANTSEDTRRIAEAESIRATLADLRTRHPDAAMAIGGDYNLVGTRAPLETLADGLSADGTPLTPARTITLGDASAVTWVDDNSMFSPGRLDWVLVDASVAEIRHAFALDTRRLSAAALTRAGLEPADSAATDHLPVVVDLLR